MPHHRIGPVEQEMPVSDQAQLSPGLLIPEADNSEAQTQLE